MGAYDGDRPIMRALGLATDWTGRPIVGAFGFTITDDWVALGTVRVDDLADVTVSVHATPAQFWRFDIRREGEADISVSTGSGTFRDYWKLVKHFIRHGATGPVAREIKRDMLVVESPEEVAAT